MNAVKTFVLMLVLPLALLLSGCGPSQQEQWQASLSVAANDARTSVQRLAKRINRGLISNTRTLRLYADSVKQIRPDAAELIDALAEDATTKGPIFKSLELRLEESKGDMQSAPTAGLASVSKLLNEFRSIEKAASPTLYGMMLTDPINVLADMSDNTLSRVESLSADASNQLSVNENLQTGSQMVGNPNYGQWRTDSSGSSFWEFYGKYALLSQLFGGGRSIYYNSWASHRPYSYYSDYGRSNYTSPRQRASQQNLHTKTASKFSKQGKTFNSPYAQKRASTRSVASKTSRASRSFESSYASRRSTRSAASSGSMRNGFSRTSRSSSGGK